MNSIEEKMSTLSDQELLDLVENKSEDYTDEAIQIAYEEIETRGGIQAIKPTPEKERKPNERQKETKPPKKHQIDTSHIFLTTETAFSDIIIKDRIGIITSEVALGMNIFKDIATVARDLVGGRSQTVQKSFANAQKTALEEIKLKAVKLNADAVVGINIEYNEISSGRSMILLSITGTAVTIN